MKLYRVFPYDGQAELDEVGGALHCARNRQGAGRHDNPDLYGAMYLSETPEGALAEQLAAFRGQLLSAALLERAGLPLALAELGCATGEVIDLDDPATLVAEDLAPSRVATRHRATTQAWSAALYRSHARAIGIRWWSVLEASWLNVTAFENRARRRLRVLSTGVLELSSPVVETAAAALGLH